MYCSIKQSQAPQKRGVEYSRYSIWVGQVVSLTQSGQEPSIFNAIWRIAVLAAWSLPGNGAVDSGAGDGEEFRQIVDRVLAGLVHPPQLFVLFVRKLGALAPQLPLGAGHRHAFAGPQTDEVDLELGEGGQDVEEHLPHRIGG